MLVLTSPIIPLLAVEQDEQRLFFLLHEFFSEMQQLFIIGKYPISVN